MINECHVYIISGLVVDNIRLPKVGLKPLPPFKLHWMTSALRELGRKMIIIYRMVLLFFIMENLLSCAFSLIQSMLLYNTVIIS